MRILHTEASPGMGGQELRILKEAIGMRERGHTVYFAIQKEGGLVQPAREAGFTVYELPFKKSQALVVLTKLCKMIRKHKIELINTHSSLDAWMGGVAGKVMGCKIIRTRHLSTPIRKGLNSRLLYNTLADRVVTTCQEVVPTIIQQAKLNPSRCSSVPTGIDPKALTIDPKTVAKFRTDLGIAPDDCLAGTLCVLRGWKGVSDLLRAAELSKEVPHLKWLIIGGGVSEAHFKQEWKSLGLQDKVIFTGHLSPPYTALAALDIFLLLSWAHEGVSQASLQAAWLEKPLVTTSTGGLKEVCIPNETGLLVDTHNPEQVAQAVQQLAQDRQKRDQMGRAAKALVERKFMLSHTLDQMEAIYHDLGSI